jgi:hypothetical protein
MKKLLSVVAVAAIVTSAFAFSTNKVATFCVRNATATGCVVVNNKFIQAGAANAKHFPLSLTQWDGTGAGCTNAAITDCSVDIRLQNN